MTSDLFMKCLIQGNLNQQEAETIYIQARSILGFKGIKSVSIDQIRPNAIPQG